MSHNRQAFCGATTVAALLLYASAPALAADDAPAVRLNQVGFLPDTSKLAVLASEETAPVSWSVVDAAGETAASGITRVLGDDAASGEHVHLIDFSAVTAPGEAYRIVTPEGESRPFAIGEGLYASLKRDALHYFYHNRASTPIEAEHAGEEWARPAGHAPDSATCFNKTDQRGNDWPGCDYTLNASRGWYDAGDHGKYVVNGGISVWTLMNYHERVELAGGEAFPDGAIAIPEAGNDISDLLDEARWQMDFMLAMQIPEGARLSVIRGPHGENAEFIEIDASGLAHHKIADERWTALPTAPHEDEETRFLYPPSTAATLNLAASAAQCARIFHDIDSDYAARCLEAAERAFAAANAHPDLYAGSFDGSGGYGDSDFDDEFYWAAAELYVTTGDKRYEKALRASPHFLAGPVSEKGSTGDIAWPNVGALGTITLALAPNGLRDREVARARASLVAAARAYAAETETVGYRIPYATDRYPWGSSSSVLNRALVLALAHDFTGEAVFRHGVVDTMDYLLGRNPLDQSYVSGYGARPMENPHHRHWARQADPSYPGPPPGALSGGPNNTAMIDPIAEPLRGTCAPQTCWRDHYEAYALNEVAINWNAPLVWVAAFLDE